MARRKEPAPPRDCEHCGKSFRPWTVSGRFCSKRCTLRDLRKPETVELERPADTDVAWAAGFFDGEGSFCAMVAPKYETSEGERQRCYLKLQVAQKYPPLLDKFQEVFGVGNVYVSKARTAAAYTCSGRKAFYVASLLWPYIGEQKKADFKRVLKRVHESRQDFVRLPQRGRQFVSERS